MAVERIVNGINLYSDGNFKEIRKKNGLCIWKRTKTGACLSITNYELKYQK